MATLNIVLESDGFEQKLNSTMESANRAASYIEERFRKAKLEITRILKQLDRVKIEIDVDITSSAATAVTRLKSQLGKIGREAAQEILKASGSIQTEVDGAIGKVGNTRKRQSSNISTPSTDLAGVDKTIDKEINQTKIIQERIKTLRTEQKKLNDIITKQTTDGGPTGVIAKIRRDNSGISNAEALAKYHNNLQEMGNQVDAITKEINDLQKQSKIKIIKSTEELSNSQKEIDKYLKEFMLLSNHSTFMKEITKEVNRQSAAQRVATGQTKPGAMLDESKLRAKAKDDLRKRRDVVAQFIEGYFSEQDFSLQEIMDKVYPARKNNQDGNGEGHTYRLKFTEGAFNQIYSIIDDLERGGTFDDALGDKLKKSIHNYEIKNKKVMDDLAKGRGEEFQSFSDPRPGLTKTIDFNDPSHKAIVANIINSLYAQQVFTKEDINSIKDHFEKVSIKKTDISIIDEIADKIDDINEKVEDDINKKIRAHAEKKFFPKIHPTDMLTPNNKTSRILAELSSIKDLSENKSIVEKLINNLNTYKTIADEDLNKFKAFDSPMDKKGFAQLNDGKKAKQLIDALAQQKVIDIDLHNELLQYYDEKINSSKKIIRKKKETDTAVASILYESLKGAEEYKKVPITRSYLLEGLKDPDLFTGEDTESKFNKVFAQARQKMQEYTDITTSTLAFAGSSAPTVNQKSLPDADPLDPNSVGFGALRKKYYSIKEAISKEIGVFHKQLSEIATKDPAIRNSMKSFINQDEFEKIVFGGADFSYDLYKKKNVSGKLQEYIDTVTKDNEKFNSMTKLLPKGGPKNKLGSTIGNQRGEIDIDFAALSQGIKQGFSKFIKDSSGYLDFSQLSTGFKKTWSEFIKNSTGAIDFDAIGQTVTNKWDIMKSATGEYLSRFKTFFTQNNSLIPEETTQIDTFKILKPKTMESVDDYYQSIVSEIKKGAQNVENGFRHGFATDEFLEKMKIAKQKLEEVYTVSKISEQAYTKGMDAIAAKEKSKFIPEDRYNEYQKVIKQANEYADTMKELETVRIKPFDDNIEDYTKRHEELSKIKDKLTSLHNSIEKNPLGVKLLGSSESGDSVLKFSEAIDETDKHMKSLSRSIGLAGDEYENLFYKKMSWSASFSEKERFNEIKGQMDPKEEAKRRVAFLKEEGVASEITYNREIARLTQIQKLEESINEVRRMRTEHEKTGNTNTSYYSTLSNLLDKAEEIKVNLTGNQRHDPKNFDKQVDSIDKYINKVQRLSKEHSKAIDSVNQKLAQHQSQMAQWFETFGMTMSGIAATIFVGQYIAVAFNSLLQLKTKLEDKIEAIGGQTKSGQTNVLTDKRQEGLEQIIRTVAATSSVSTDESASYLKDQLMRGKDLNDAVKSLAFTKINNEIDNLSNTVKAFTNILQEVALLVLDLFGDKIKNGLSTATAFIREHKAALSETIVKYSEATITIVSAFEPFAKILGVIMIGLQSLIGLNPGLAKFALGGAAIYLAFSKIPVLMVAIASLSNLMFTKFFAGGLVTIGTTAASVAGLVAGKTFLKFFLSGATMGLAMILSVVIDKITDSVIKGWSKISNPLSGNTDKIASKKQEIDDLSLSDSFSSSWNPFSTDGAIDSSWASKREWAVNKVKSLNEEIAELQQQNRDKTTKAIVVGVLDGDTVAVKIGDEFKKVRMAYLDAEESVHMDIERNSVKGTFASVFMHSLLSPGDVVELSDYLEESGELIVDKHDRIIAKIAASNKSLNALMIQSGLAKYKEYNSILTGAKQVDKELEALSVSNRLQEYTNKVLKTMNQDATTSGLSFTDQHIFSRTDKDFMRPYTEEIKQAGLIITEIEKVQEKINKLKLMNVEDQYENGFIFYEQQFKDIQKYTKEIDKLEASLDKVQKTQRKFQNLKMIGEISGSTEESKWMEYANDQFKETYGRKSSKTKDGEESEAQKALYSNYMSIYTDLMKSRDEVDRRAKAARLEATGKMLESENRLYEKEYESVMTISKKQYEASIEAGGSGEMVLQRMQEATSKYVELMSQQLDKSVKDAIEAKDKLFAINFKKYVEILPGSKDSSDFTGVLESFTQLADNPSRKALDAFSASFGKMKLEEEGKKTYQVLLNMTEAHLSEVLSLETDASNKKLIIKQKEADRYVSLEETKFQALRKTYELQKKQNDAEMRELDLMLEKMQEEYRSFEKIESEKLSSELKSGNMNDVVKIRNDIANAISSVSDQSSVVVTKRIFQEYKDKVQQLVETIRLDGLALEGYFKDFYNNKKDMNVDGGSIFEIERPYSISAADFKPDDYFAKDMLKYVLSEIQDQFNKLPRDKNINDMLKNQLIQGPIDLLSSLDVDPNMIDAIKTKMETAIKELNNSIGTIDLSVQKINNSKTEQTSAYDLKVTDYFMSELEKIKTKSAQYDEAVESVTGGSFSAKSMKLDKTSDGLKYLQEQIEFYAKNTGNTQFLDEILKKIGMTREAYNNWASDIEKNKLVFDNEGDFKRGMEEANLLIQNNEASYYDQDKAIRQVINDQMALMELMKSWGMTEDFHSPLYTSVSNNIPKAEKVSANLDFKVKTTGSKDFYELYKDTIVSGQEDVIRKLYNTMSEYKIDENQLTKEMVDNDFKIKIDSMAAYLVELSKTNGIILDKEKALTDARLLYAKAIADANKKIENDKILNSQDSTMLDGLKVAKQEIADMNTTVAKTSYETGKMIYSGIASAFGDFTLSLIDNARLSSNNQIEDNLNLAREEVKTLQAEYDAAKATFDKESVIDINSDATKTASSDLKALSKDLITAKENVNQLEYQFKNAPTAFDAFLNSFTSMMNQVLRIWTETLIKMQMEKLMRETSSTSSSSGWLTSLLQSVGSMIGGLFGGPSSASVANAAIVTDPIGGWVGFHHGGGIIGQDSPSAVAMQNYSLWNGSPRLHSGLLPDEYRAILKKDEGVFTPAQMKALGTPVQTTEPPKAPEVKIVVNNNLGKEASVKQDTKFDGQEMIVTLWLDAYQRNSQGLRSVIG